MAATTGGAEKPTTGSTTQPTNKTSQLQAIAQNIRSGTDKVKLAKQSIKDRTGYTHVETMGKDLIEIKKAIGDLQSELGKPQKSNSIFWPAIGLSAACLTAIAMTDIYVGMRSIIRAIDRIPGIELERSDRARAMALPSSNTSARMGDVIAGYSVTSGYGPRQSPCTGCSSYHEAIDLGTPMGTAVYAPYRAEVECRFNKPSGNIAHIKPVGVDAPEFLALHLSKCTPGKFQPGDLIAITGDTGNGTGPHLDWRQLVKGEYVHPTKEWIKIALTGKTPSIDTISLIKEMEQFSTTPYWDRHQFSWGYGTKAPGAGGTITKVDAEQELVSYLETYCYPLINPLTLTKYQEAAINSFCYNVGPDQFSSSKVYTYLRTGAHTKAANELDRWTKSNGEELPGLVSRRKIEKDLFLTNTSNQRYL